MIDRFLLDSKALDPATCKLHFYQLTKLYPHITTERLLLVARLIEYCQIKETESPDALKNTKYLIANDLMTELLISNLPIQVEIQKCLGADFLKKPLIKKNRLRHIITSFIKTQNALPDKKTSATSLDDLKSDEQIILPIHPIRDLYLKKPYKELKAPSSQETLEEHKEFIESNKALLPETILDFIHLCTQSIIKKGNQFSLIELHKINRLIDTIMINPLIDIDVLINEILPPVILKHIDSPQNSQFNQLIASLRLIAKQQIEHSHSEEYLINHLRLLCDKYKEIYSPRRQILLLKKQQEITDKSPKKDLSRAYEIKKQTLYPARLDRHKIKIYSNTYDDDTLSSGAFYDMKKAIEQAEKFICIASWNNSLTGDLRMGKTLACLLEDAAKRNVKVYILIWNHIHPNKQNTIKKNYARILSTESPNIFYKKSNRNDDFLDTRCYSHHQKIFLTEKTTFICGMDFVPKTVDSKEHSGTYGYFWHDASVQAQGSIILDVFETFNARWRSQPQECMLYNSDIESRKLLTEHHYYLQSLYEQKERTTTHEQSIQFLVSLSKNDYQSPLRMWPLHKDYTNEIHKTILKMIQEAKNYIFISNQYFISQYIGHEFSPNGISTALIDRVLTAHRNQEPFHVYLTLPLHEKKNALTDRSLARKEWKTIEYMISEINKKTKNKSINYLTITQLDSINKLNEHHQIYVHSKFLFTPDGIIIGSANFNERSLSGERDSEAMLHIRGYTAEQAEFRDSILEEYYGTNTLFELKKQGVSHVLGETKAQDIIQSSIDERFYKTLSKTPASHQDDLPGTAQPWGLIARKELMQGKKPPRIPGSESILVASINHLGYNKYTR